MILGRIASADSQVAVSSGSAVDHDILGLVGTEYHTVARRVAENADWPELCNSDSGKDLVLIEVLPLLEQMQIHTKPPTMC